MSLLPFAAGFARLRAAYTGWVITALVSAVRFFWVATAGHRLRPWRSEYLRWRMETYTGKAAGSLQLMDFLQLAWRERGQMLRFFAWTGEIHDIANGEKP